MTTSERKLIAAAFVSLDGVMQAPGGETEDPTGGFRFGGWLPAFFDDAVGAFIGESFSRPFDLLLGRKTYEIFAAHWPFMPADDPVRVPFDKATKYVATRSASQPLDWVNSVRLADVPADIARLKQQGGPDLLTQGSANLMQTLLKHELIDEFRLLTFPVILGDGKRFFGPDAAPRTLSLTSSAISSTGVIMSAYTRAGAVETSTFATPKGPEAAAANTARQARMKREG
jgi:dihydrofolate reductase